MSDAQNTKTASKPLSAKAIDAMKSGAKPKVDVGEYTGLRVVCGKSGVKTFIYRYRSPINNKIKQHKIGSYPQVTLAMARLKLEELKALRATGVCPVQAKKEKAEDEKATRLRVQQVEKSQSFTIKAMVDLYLSEYIEGRYITDKKNPEIRKLIPGARKPKGQSEVRRSLYNDAVAVLGEQPASKTTRKMIVDLIMSMTSRGVVPQAGVVLRELTSAYEYAIGLNYFSEDFSNPALAAKASLKQARVKLTSTKGKRVLTEQELVEVLRWLPVSGFTQNQKNVLRLTLLTGCRSGEVCEASWQDIDLEKGTWLLKETKNGTDRDVQLSRQAIDFLKKLKVEGETYVFQSKTSGKPIQQKSLTEVKWQLRNADTLPNRRKYTEQQRWPENMKNWSPHDLRRTVRTFLSKLGCPSDVAETVLGHTLKGIEGTYNLHSYEKECKIWLQKWADYLDAL
jgi:integrase